MTTMLLRLSRLPLAAHLLAAFVLVSGLSACSSTPKEDAYVERPAEELYQQADAALKAENYVTAAKLYDEVERQHPYSQWAAKAQIMAAFAQYQDLKYDDAILALDRYIQLHPGNKDIAYAYYLRALCFYEQITDVRRDQKVTRKALDALAEVVRRFPETTYARDAKIKIDLTNDHLAGQEMEIGRFYMKRNEYTAAIGRFRTVVENYQTTSHVPEALHRLVECYLALGIPSEAKTAAAVLGHNFPGSEWYKDSYSLLVGAKMLPEEDRSSWISRAWHSLF